MTRGRPPKDQTTPQLRKTRGPMRKNQRIREATALADAADAGSAVFASGDAAAAPASAAKSRRKTEKKGKVAQSGATVDSDKGNLAQSLGSEFDEIPVLKLLKRYGKWRNGEYEQIRAIYERGLSAKDLHAIWIAQYLSVEREASRKRDPLAAAAAIQAKNQLIGYLTKIVELGERKDPALPQSMSIVVQVDAAPSGNGEAPPPGPCGDVMEPE